MYVGHAAVALVLKSREPRLPLIPLTLACFGPDWIEVSLMFPKREGMAIYTHSIPAVMLGAAAAGLLYAAFRRPGARMIVLAWLLHWPADLLTGRKPIFASTPLVGLDLYSLPFADFLIESVAVVVACAVYARLFAARGELRRVVVMLGATLIVLQGAVDATLSVIRGTEWTPSLALFGRKTQVEGPAAGPGGPVRRT
ncbi:MAG: hypothetical protein ABI601_15295 [bacterium]